MSNITKLEFAALDILGKKYLSWILNAEIHLDAMNLGNTIKGGNTATLQDCAKALIFIRHHIDEGLKSEYLTVKDPVIFWTSLKERYDHRKTFQRPVMIVFIYYYNISSQLVTTTQPCSKLVLN